MKGTPINDLKDLSKADLERKLDDAYKELFNLRFQRAQGQLTDATSIKTVRHNIARIKTVLNWPKHRPQQEKKA
jgi:large subunit ribosomal protein L29